MNQKSNEHVQHHLIERKKLREEYKKEVIIQENTKEEYKAIVWYKEAIRQIEISGHMKFIGVLSDARYKVFYSTLFRARSYIVWDEDTEKGLAILEEILNPKSVREKIRNAQRDKGLPASPEHSKKTQIFTGED